MRSALVCDITQYLVVIPPLRFGISSRFHLQSSRNPTAQITLLTLIAVATLSVPSSKFKKSKIADHVTESDCCSFYHVCHSPNCPIVSTNLLTDLTDRIRRSLATSSDDCNRASGRAAGRSRA